jgi:hypothetical protein
LSSFEACAFFLPGPFTGSLRRTDELGWKARRAEVGRGFDRLKRQKTHCEGLLTLIAMSQDSGRYQLLIEPCLAVQEFEIRNPEASHALCQQP